MIIVYEGRCTNYKAPYGEWLFRRDSDVLLSPECLVQWKESVLHYAWWLLFSSHGAVRRHCRSCPVSTYCNVFTDFCFGVYFNPLPLLLFSLFALFHCVMEMALEDSVGSINWSCLQSGVDPGLRRALSRAGCCDKASPCCQATQENEREKVALLWSPCIISHSKWQPSTQAQMPTDAGVSARGVCVDVCMCAHTASWMCVCVCFSSFMPLVLWKLAAYSILRRQIT